MLECVDSSHAGFGKIIAVARVLLLELSILANLYKLDRDECTAKRKIFGVRMDAKGHAAFRSAKAPVRFPVSGLRSSWLCASQHFPT